MEWPAIAVVLCAAGFLKDFRPIEPFLTPYLRSEGMNFTEEDLYSRVYPVWTYSYLLLLVPIFLLSDLLRYRPVLILGGVAYLGTCLLLWLGRTVGQMQLMQVLYGCATAAEVAYFAYAYAAVEPRRRKALSSHVRVSLECSRLTAYASGQLFVWLRMSSVYKVLNYIAVGTSSLHILLCCALPSISWRRCPTDKTFPEVVDETDVRSRMTDDPAPTDVGPKTYRDFMRLYLVNLWTTFRNSYSCVHVWRWSLWWSLATCGHLQVNNYSQNLWDLMQDSQLTNVWNGAVEVIKTCLTMLSVLAVQYIPIRWTAWGELCMALISAVDCALLMLMSITNSLTMVYILYIMYKVFYKVFITIVMYNIVKKLENESFGLVFGFNTLLALVLQSLLTLIVVDQMGLALSIRHQFIVYGAYHGVIAIPYLIIGIAAARRYFVSTERFPDQMSPSNVESA